MNLAFAFLILLKQHSLEQWWYNHSTCAIAVVCITENSVSLPCISVRSFLFQDSYDFQILRKRLYHDSDSCSLYLLMEPPSASSGWSPQCVFLALLITISPRKSKKQLISPFHLKQMKQINSGSNLAKHKKKVRNNKIFFDLLKY